ncbi:unnamed protein product [Tenebrio molitor]|nr:unnamed protein product [Tenebrio molitor]
MVSWKGRAVPLSMKTRDFPCSQPFVLMEDGVRRLFAAFQVSAKTLVWRDFIDFVRRFSKAGGLGSAGKFVERKNDLDGCTLHNRQPRTSFF